ncbi:30S ribosomal protein S20 [candidate division CSSED10-310 bacterium]|uniref:Small ribosomal subunit protein bS20 n=1 Tax=candidate division CSSED10-310 bacterium TaxID=2855610 RepID=A0ABV6YZ03_UNCC1
MAHSRSTKKRIRQNIKNRVRNRHHVSQLRNIVKTMEQAINNKDMDEIKVKLPQTITIIDKSVAFGIIHKNKGARTKSQLMRKVNSLSKA